VADKVEKVEKKQKGFRVMDPETVRKIAVMGGKATPSGERGFSRNRDLAVRAGRKGGQRSKGGGRVKRTGQPEKPEQAKQ